MENNIGIALVNKLCVICCKVADNIILMNKKLTKKHKEEIKKLHHQNIGFAKKPCEECQKMLDKAFLFIGYDEEKSDMDNIPEGFYRTGHIVGVKKDCPLVTEWVKSVYPSALEHGFMFTDYNTMVNLGLIKKDGE